MAVREFDGTDDLINLDVGAMSAFDTGIDHSCAFIVKKGTDAAWMNVVASSSTGSRRYEWKFTNGNRLALGRMALGDSLSTFTVTVSDGWVLLGVTKAGGSGSTPRVHKYRYSDQTWTHEDGDATLDDVTGVNQLRIAANAPSDEFLNGRVAAAGMWLRVLPDAEFEGLTDTLSAWVVAAPDALWAFNQASTATPVDDLTGNGADETSLTGTTVVTDDDPPGFNFDPTPPQVMYSQLRYSVVAP